jgi:excisionase family DNA binding protein
MAAGYYSLSQAARVLGVHYETAARWARSGKLPAVRVSRRKVLVPKEKCAAILSGGLGAASEVGTIQRWLPLIGTLSPREAARLRELAQDFERVEEGG